MSHSVRSLLRRQADVNHSSRSNSQNRSGLEPERPVSEYDNIKPSAIQTHFPLSDIKFRFDDSPFPTSIMNNNTTNQSAMHYNNSEDPQTTTLPVHQYENVSSTLQARSKQRESDQQVKMIDRSPPRSVMSPAKSSFFGLSSDQQKSPTDEEFDKLIEDIGNASIVPHKYENVPPNRDFTDDSKAQSNQDKVSATSSASGSSSTTATPSSSPTRQDRTGNSRKNSEGSNRSKSPKFMLPESSTPSSPSQVNYSSDDSREGELGLFSDELHSTFSLIDIVIIGRC